MYRYHQLTVHHATHLVITSTEHLMLIFLIIIHAPELNLQRSIIKLPFDALQCENVDCTSHRKDIDVFYYIIINTLNNCTKQCIPVLKLHENNYIAGWNEHVSCYYNILRIEFKWSVYSSRSRHGSIYHAMRSSRARFKYTLRQCQLDERLIVSKKLADHMKIMKLTILGKI